MGLMGGKPDELCELDPALPAPSLLPASPVTPGHPSPGHPAPLGLTKQGAVAKGRELVCAPAQRGGTGGAATSAALWGVPGYLFFRSSWSATGRKTLTCMHYLTISGGYFAFSARRPQPVHSQTSRLAVLPPAVLEDSFPTISLHVLSVSTALLPSTLIPTSGNRKSSRKT